MQILGLMSNHLSVDLLTYTILSDLNFFLIQFLLKFFLRNQLTSCELKLLLN